MKKNQTYLAQSKNIFANLTDNFTFKGNRKKLGREVQLNMFISTSCLYSNKVSAA